MYVTARGHHCGDIALHGDGPRAARCRPPRDAHRRERDDRFRCPSRGVCVAAPPVAIAQSDHDAIIKRARGQLGPVQLSASVNHEIDAAKGDAVVLDELFAYLNKFWAVDAGLNRLVDWKTPSAPRIPPPRPTRSTWFVSSLRSAGSTATCGRSSAPSRPHQRAPGPHRRGDHRLRARRRRHVPGQGRREQRRGHGPHVRFAGRGGR